MSAPVIKPKYQISIDATKIVVSDITGAYNVTTNPTGWGTPNWALNQTAIWMAVKRKASIGDEFFTPSANQITYNASATNADITALEFGNANDGVLEVTVGALAASTDGINYVAGGAIGEGDYFYWANSGFTIWHKVSGVNVSIADVNTLVGNASVTQVTITDIPMARLAIIKQGLYKKWTISRDTDCDDAEPLFQEQLKLAEDIKGAIYSFYSGLTVQAQSQVETMLDRYDLVNQ